jgi:hypothetical protein
VKQTGLPSPDRTGLQVRAGQEPKRILPRIRDAGTDLAALVVSDLFETSEAFANREWVWAMPPARFARRITLDAGSWGSVRNALTPGYSISRLRREEAGEGARGPRDEGRRLLENEVLFRSDRLESLSYPNAGEGARGPNREATNKTSALPVMRRLTAARLLLVSSFGFFLI